MKLTHAGDDCLTRFFIRIGSEGWVFLCQLCEGYAHFFLTRFCFRFDCNLDNGLRKFHRFEDDRMLFIAQCVACCRVFRADNGSNVTCVASVYILSLVCMHLENTTEAFSHVLFGVQSGFARLDAARINAEEAELAHIGVGHNLECESRERSVIGRRSLLFLLRIGVYTSYMRNIGRCGHIIDNRVKQFLNALVFIGRAARHGDNLVCDCFPSERALDFFGCQFFPAAILFKQLLIGFGDSLNHVLSVLVCKIYHVCRDRLDAHILAQVVIIDVRFHIDKVDNSSEGIFLANGKLNRNGICFETFLHHFDYTIEVRAVYVHLVDISHSRDSVFVSLTPYGFRLRLNTAFGTEYRYGTVQNSERTLNLDREVNVSGRVYDVDSVSFPETSGGSGGNCDTSLLLLLHPVHGGRAVMGFAKLVCLTGVIKDSFCGSRFAGVDVSHDTNISCMFKRIFSWHI